MFLRNSEQPYDFACHFIDVVSDYSIKAKTLTFIQFTRLNCRECGLMDKAPDFGSGDCRFESCHSRNLFLILGVAHQSHTEQHEMNENMYSKRFPRRESNPGQIS